MPDKKYLIEIPDMPESSGVWDADKWERNKDKFMQKYPDANIFEVGQYDPEDTSENDQFMLSFEEDPESSGIWDADKWERNKDAFMAKYPQAQVNRVRYVDYWGDAAKQNRARREQLSQPDTERDARLADLGYFDDISGQGRNFSMENPDSIPLKPVSSAMEQNSVSGEMTYRDPKLAEFYANDSAHNGRMAEVARLDAEYESNPVVVAQREWEEERKQNANRILQEAEEAYKNIDHVAVSRYQRAFEGSPTSAKTIAKGMEDAAKDDAIAMAFTMLKEAETLRGGVGEGALKGFGKNLILPSTLDGEDYQRGQQALIKTFMKLQDAMGPVDEWTEEKMEEILTKEEMLMVESFFELSAAYEDTEGKLSEGYEAGRAFAHSVPFMIQFMMSAGMSDMAAKPLAQGLTKMAAKKLAKKAGASMVKKALNTTLRQASRLGIGVAQAATSGAVQTITQAGTTSGVLDAMMQFDNDGYMSADAQTIATAYFDKYVENFSEGMGEVLGGITGTALKGTGRALNKAFKTTAFTKLGGAFGKTTIGKLGKAAGVHNGLFEMAEEAIGAAIRDITIDENAWEEFSDQRNLLITALSFLPTTVMGGALSLGQIGAAKLSFERSQTKMQERLAGYVTPEQMDYIINTARSTSAESLVDTMKPILIGMQLNGASTEQINAVRDYMVSAARYQTMMGAEETKAQEQRNATREKLEQEYGKFYHAPTTQNKAGEQIELSPMVRTARLKDGRDVYIVSDSNEMGEFLTIDMNTKKKGTAKESDIAEQLDNNGNAQKLTMTESLNDYLSRRVMLETKETEAARMNREYQEQVDAIRSEIQEGTRINLGTEGSPVILLATGRTSDAGVEAIDNTGVAYTIGWEQTADALRKPIKVLTDAQIVEQEIADIVARDAERKARMAQQKGGNSAAANEATAEANQTEEAVAQDTRHIPLNEDGTVNEAAFWEQDPEGYAQWNDEQNQDGGADTIQQIEAAKAELTAMLNEAQQATLTSNPANRKAAKREVNRLAERLARLEALEQSYADKALAPLRERAKMWADLTGAQVHVIETEEELAAISATAAQINSNANSRVRGFAKDGKAYIYLPEVKDIKEIDELFFHEAVAHNGLKGLLGKEGFDQLCEQVWNMMSQAARNKFINYPGVKGNHLAAADEYIAFIAEKMGANIATAEEKTIWQKIVDFIRNILRDMGIEIAFTEQELSDLLHQAYADLANNMAKAERISSGEAMSAVEEAPSEARQQYDALLADLTPEEIEAVAENDFNAAQEAYNAHMTNAPKVQPGESSKAYIERKKAYNDELKRLESELNAQQALMDEIAAIKAANAPVLTDAEILQHDGFGVDEQNDDVRMSVRYIPTDEQRAAIIESIVNVTGRTREDAEKWLASETSLAAMINDDLQYLDYVADPKYKAIKDNSDYPQGTVDFNNICRKRVPFTRMFTRLQRTFPNRVFTADELADIRTIMSKDGLTVACGLCYVEDRRQMVGEVAQSFIDGLQEGFKTYANNPTKKKNAEKFNALIGEDTYVPQIYDLTTQEGLDKLYNEHRGIWEAFQAFNNARGQQSQNLLQGYAEYKREILSWSDKKVKQVNDNGGLRIFSYSDFEAHHLIDVVQIIIDCAAKGVKIQGYTKVPAFARAVANTGIKLNRSLIPLGDTGLVDGQLAFDPVEGIDINDPNFLESNDNVGNILIGINDEQIRIAMADPRIHYIIPYHARQKENIRQKLNVGAWTNYISTQNERNISDGKRVKDNINIYTDILTRDITNDRQFVEKYLQLCAEQGRIPKFDQFLDKDAEGNYVYTPGYYKFLIDFKLFDENGNILPQKPVVAEFDDAFNMQILEDYARDEKEATGEQMNETYDKIVDALSLDESEAEGEDIRFSLSMESLGKAAKTIRNWADNGLRGRSFELTLPKDTLAKVRAVMGRDFDSHNITANGIAHALNSHGVGGYNLQENSIPITTEDLELIPYIMVAPDYVTKGSTDPSGRESVRFYKALSNGVVVVIEKEYKNSPDDMETINMWAEMSSKATNAQQNAAPGINVQNAILSTDAAKIRKDAESAIERDGKNQKSDDTRLSVITPEQDKAYMDAVEAGDMETAQRMVIEAAKLAMPDTKVVDENGNPRVVYHQTNAKIYVNRETGQNWDDLNWKEKMEWDERDDWEDYWEEQDFNAFSRINARTTNEFDGFFFAPKFDEYHEYGDRTIAAFVNITNPASREDYNIDSTQNDAGRKERIRLQEAGFDGVIRMDGEEVDEYIAFEPSQIKSAEPVTYDNDGNVIPLSERFNPENADIRFRMSNDNQAIFVSNAAKAVEGIKQEKATPEQWLKMIEKNGGLKAGEDKWMGLSDWLKASDKKTLTKAEVLDFINENMIIIEEQHYSNQLAYENNSRLMDEKYPGWQDAFSFEWDDYRDAPAASLLEESEAAALYNAHNEDQVEVDEDGDIVSETDRNKVVLWGEDIAKIFFGREGEAVRPIHDTREVYTTKGLVNKHEIALTVPTIESWEKSDMIHFGDAGDGRAVAWIRFGETSYKTVSEDSEFYNESIDALYAYWDYLREKYGNGWTNAMTDAEKAEEKRIQEKYKVKRADLRKKVLVIDEIQSKRYQEGREKGYKPAIDVRARLNEIAKRLKELGKMESTSTSGLTDEQHEERDKLLDEEIRLIKAGPIPDAPFDKNWHELAMKRMLRYAAENGYDIIAWTKGDQQANRYDLSRDVKKISASKQSKDGERIVNIYYRDEYDDYKNLVVDKEGKVIYGDFFGSNLADVVGKEMALQIMNAEDATEFKGEGLKIGGEGMRGFYDKMLPAFMNKYGKKWGVKVEDIDLPNLGNSGYTMHSVPVTEEMKASVMEGQVMFRVRGDNESALDFHKDTLIDFKRNFNTPKPTTVVDVNDRNAVAEALGYTPEEFTDKMYQQIIDGVNDGGKSLYDAGKKRIAIFAIEDSRRSADVEENIFHENTHGIIAEHPELLELGEWLWDNSQPKSRQQIKQSILDSGYYEGQYHNEMLSRYTGLVLAKGMAGAVMQKLPADQQKHWELILNEFGYEPEREDGNRRRRFESDTRGMGTPGYGQERQQEVSDNGASETRFRTTEITPEVQAEMDVISATALMNGTYLKAPNGADTNLTAEQWAMVRTKNFLRWFGDWINDPENASKVVDENGEPKVVYHGTNLTVANRGVPFWTFYEDQHFGTRSQAEEMARAGWPDAERKVYETFLNIRNIKRVKDAPQDWILTHSEYWEPIFNDAKAEGYDGLVYQNDWEDSDSKADSFVVFDPSQIKSATDNTGEFSEEEGDIRFRVADSESKREIINNTEPVDVTKGAIAATDGESVSKAALRWFEENVGKELTYNTEVGTVTINRRSVKNSLAHGYSQTKLDAITSLPEGFGRAVYLASEDDFDGKPEVNHYFVYPINYDGSIHYVLCRVKSDVNKSSLYIHEVFPIDAIKGHTLQTAADQSQPHRGISLYLDLLKEVLYGKDTDNLDNTNDSEENISLRVTGTPTDEVVVSGLNLSPAQTAELAGNIFAALPEDSRKKITDGLNGDFLGIQDAIMQIPASLAMKEEWDEEDKNLASVVREKVQDMVDAKGVTSRPLTTKEALWMLYDAMNPISDLISAASKAIVAQNLGFDQESQRIRKMTDDHIRYSVVRNNMIDAATDVYNYETSLWTERLKESWLDMNQSVKSLQNAIADASGIPIEPWENIVYALNRLSSKSYADKKKYLRDYLTPLWDTISDIVKHDHVSIEEIERYMMLKHALERNEIFAKRDAKEFYRGMYDEVARRMKSQSHAEKVVALSEAKKALADIDAQISTATGAKLQKLKDERVNAQYKVDVADLALRGDEKQNEADLQAYYNDIDAGTDPKYREFREKDYGGLTSMFVDTTDVKRSDYKSEEAYQRAILAATTPRYDDVAAMESAAEREVSLFENKVYMHKALWDKVNAATKETLRHQYESGMITIEQYEAVRDMFEHYVPLRGFADNTAEDMYSYYMNNSSNGFSMPIIGAKGRKTKAESPLGWIGTMAESAIQADNKNEAKMSLYYAILRRPDQNLLSITETWFEYTGKKDANGKKIYAPAYPPKTDRVLNADELRQHMEDWESDMKSKQAHGKAFKGTQAVNLRGSVIFQEDKQEKEHIIRVKVAGKDYSILVNGNPRAAQAINGLLNPEANVGPVREWIGWARRGLSSLLTSFSPLFWVANYQRDLLSSTMRTSEAYGWGEAMRYLNNRRKAWRVASYVCKHEDGTLGDSYYENLYKEFVDNGGVTGYTALTSNKEYEKLLEDYAKEVNKPSVIKWAKKKFRNFLSFGEAIEQVSRFAAFITARESGKPIEEAINAAKEVSVNFNRKGSAQPISRDELEKLRTKDGQKLNEVQKVAVIVISAMPSWLKELYFFFNASVQAISSSLKLAAKSPGKAAGWAGAYFGMSIAMAMLNYLLSGDDEDEYLDLPDYLRHSTVLIKVGDEYYIKWSIPQEMRPFYAWADMLVSKMMGKMPHKHLGMEMALAAAQWLPVNPFESEDPLLSLVPDVASPIVEAATNKTSFGGKIYDDMAFKSEGTIQDIPAYRKATEKTGKIYVDLAEILNTISGGDEVQKGKVNVNPAALEHLVEGYGGGIYDFAKMIVTFPGMVLDAVTGEDPLEVKNIPFVNKVVMSVDETNMYSHTNDAFYHYKKIAESAKRIEKEYAESSNPERAEAYRQEEDWRIYLLYKQYEADFKNVKERLDKAVDKDEEDLLKQEQNVLREMFLQDIAKGNLPEVTFEIREDVKRIEKELKRVMKPANDANKERLERRKAGDPDGMLAAIEKMDSLKNTPEYKKAEAANATLKEVKKRLSELGSVERHAQRDSVIGELQKYYEQLKEQISELE